MTAQQRRRITAAAVPEPPPNLFSHCLAAGDLVFVSGQHAGAPVGGVLGDGTMESQARETLKKVKALIEAAGATMADIVKLTVYTTDIGQRAAIAKARQEFFSGDFPCSTLVEIKALVDPALKVEIEAIAVKRTRAKPK